MEWLFIVTKPSFFSAVSFAKKVRILLFTGAFLSTILLAAAGVLFIFSRVLRGAKVQSILLSGGVLILAVVSGCLGLLLFDNFTYTVLKFGIISSEGFITFLYLTGFIILCGYLFLNIKKNLTAFDQKMANKGFRKYVDAAITAVLLAALILNYERPDTYSSQFASFAQHEREDLPNIILITADGLNAANTSVYGYERDTTPRLRELAAESLVAENAFNNSGSTMGSVISIYTGKYPTQTRTLYAPDILKGKDAYQHLPNILKSLGYHNIQYTHPHHADAFARNVLSSFDEANGKIVQPNNIQEQFNRYLDTDYAYFFYEISNRIADRLRHITFNKKMVARQDLILGETKRFDDQAKIDRILQVIEESSQPVFAHLHWMGTHGATFLPNHRTYSQGKDTASQVMWDVDFYDDSILDFDAGVGQVIDRLTAIGEYNNTILVIGSDHGQNYVTNKRIPLIIHFPSGQHHAVIQSNVQNIDIAPTLLDYLGVEKPAWMNGTSLLPGEPGDRPIFGTGVGKDVEVERGSLVVETLKPPFYQFGYISVIYCGTWYRLDLVNYAWMEGPVEGYTGSCSETSPIDRNAVLNWMVNRLREDGFDTSSITAPGRSQQ